MKNELEMLTEIAIPGGYDCTYDGYLKAEKNHKCLVLLTDCNGCIFDGRYRSKTNKRLQELIPIISLEDL